MTTDFTWIRHGQTAENLAGIVQGHLDTHLDELGRRQAACAAERLKDEEFDAIFCSHLHRARETAEIIGNALGMEPVSQEALSEWNLGALQGHQCAELQEKFPEVMDSFRHEGANVKVPEGETHDEFFGRVAECLDRLAQDYAGKRLLLVTHGGTLRAIFHHVVGPVVSGCRLPVTSNAGYGRFFRHDDQWQLCCWNDTSHLKDVGVRASLTF